jgi:hypothetical protein
MIKVKINKRKYNMRPLTVMLVLVIVFLVFVMTKMFGFYENYSNGERAGSLYKFSQKGLIIKSWEGEMHVGTGVENGIMVPIKWHFSVRDPVVAKEIQDAMSRGGRIVLHYNEWFLKPCYQDSNYTVTKVDVPEFVKE